MNNNKPILAIETSGSLCSVCLYYTDEQFFETNLAIKHSHSEKLFEIIEKTLDTAKIKINDVECLAISSGPGSFTGLRIGFSAGKGIATGAGLGIIPVPTFESYATEIANYLNEGDEFIVSSKASSDEVYYAKFKVKENSYIFVDDLMIMDKKKLEEMSKTCAVFGSGVKNSRIPKEPSALFVAKWAVKNGESLLTKEFDYLEPNYLKKFIVRGFENV